MGSHTAGTDGRTIESLADMQEEDFVSLIQNSLQGMCQNSKEGRDSQTKWEIKTVRHTVYY